MNRGKECSGVGFHPPPPSSALLMIHGHPTTENLTVSHPQILYTRYRCRESRASMYSAGGPQVTIPVLDVFPSRRERCITKRYNL